MAEDDFSWNDNDAVVVEPVDAIAVYTDPKGTVVIRQRGSQGEADRFIYVPPDSVEDLIAGLRKAASGGTTMTTAADVQGDGGGAPINP